MRKVRRQLGTKFVCRVELILKNCDGEPSLLLPAVPDHRFLSRELFVAWLDLLSLQAGAGIALQGLITQADIA